MTGYNLPDNVNPNDPNAPWNQEASPGEPTTVRLRVHYAGQVREFIADWDWCPSEEEAIEDFINSAQIEVEYLD